MNLLIIASALLAATVTSKNLEEVYSDEKVVTAVSFDGLATTEDLKNATPTDYETVKSNAASALSKAEANEKAIVTKANANDVYKKTETYSQTEIDTKVASAPFIKSVDGVSTNSITVYLQSDDTNVVAKVTTKGIEFNASWTQVSEGVGYWNFTPWSLMWSDILTSESDPNFAAWTNGTNLAAGYQAVIKAGRKQCTVFGSYAAAYADKGSAFGYFARVGAQRGTAIGYNAYVPWDWTGAIGFAQFPTNVYFGADIDNQTEDGAWVETPRTLQSYLDERATTNDLAEVKASIPAISATDATFSNAVLAVGLNIDTNAVAQINELLTDGAKLPTSGVATVGGLLAALAAAIVALKKSVSTLSAKVDDANAALEEVA